jgi:16S rRNA (uracil1498-N3)-methyltransferase
MTWFSSLLDWRRREYTRFGIEFGHENEIKTQISATQRQSAWKQSGIRQHALEPPRPNHGIPLQVPMARSGPTKHPDLAFMSRYDFRSPRLFVATPLGSGLAVTLDAAQIHYLASVLRMTAGDPVLVFNGVDGEWKARLAGAKRNVVLLVETRIRSQPEPSSLHYLFSPLKRARLDYMVQKAVEMGVSRLHPVIMRHTQAERVNLDRMRANAIEAAEQCGILTIPQIAAPLDFGAAIAALGPSCRLVFCDEDASCSDPVAALRADLGEQGGSGVELAVLIGPEGGFGEEERAMLLRRPRTSRIALGPRILRADTAAVAALAVVQTAAGDWR